MIPLQLQARALGDPTRHGIFRYITDAERPVGIAELTAHFGLNHNAIRQHLAKLVDAELVAAATQAGPRGRPRLMYETDPGAESRWGVVSPYERLSLLLAEMIRSGDGPVEVGQRAAQQYRNPEPDADATDTINSVMARLGFEPAVRRRGRRVEIALGNCPFAATALAEPDIVCSLHLGLAQGLTDGTNTVVDELVAKDPRRADCRIRLRSAPVTAT